MKRMLCVDDSEGVLSMLVEMLEPQFTIVGTATSGADALAKVAELKPEIILLDIDLGDMSGFAVAERLRASDCQAKIIFVSAHESVSFVKAAWDAGAGFVGKSRLASDLVETCLKAA